MSATNAPRAFRRDSRVHGAMLPASMAQALCALHEQRQRLNDQRRVLTRDGAIHHAGVGSLLQDLEAVAAAIEDLEAFGVLGQVAA